MYKSCSRCGKIHPSNFKCSKGKMYIGGDERKLRAKYVWAKKSKEIRERANHLCEVCRDNNIFNYNDLEVHHIEKVKDNKHKLLDNYNLVCLCVEHHKLADAGKIDADYLRDLARKREGEESPPSFQEY